jgi:hypothetical protein
VIHQSGISVLLFVHSTWHTSVESLIEKSEGPELRCSPTHLRLNWIARTIALPESGAAAITRQHKVVSGSHEGQVGCSCLTYHA